MSWHRALAVVLLASLGTGPALRAQYEISGRSFSPLWMDRTSVPNAANNTPPIYPTQPQFAGVKATAAGSLALSASTTLSARYPSQIYLNPTTGSPSGTVILSTRSGFGGTFASGVPRYNLGDPLQPPTTQDGGILVADSTYWRALPAAPGETFTHPADNSISTPVGASSVPLFYSSPHAQRAFASRPGRITATWVTRVPVASGTDSTLKYRFREESFSVSASTTKPTRTIYWTEKNFTAPIVIIPNDKIEMMNPIYTSLFPATVSTEYAPVGTSASASNPAPAELRTLWFEKLAGIGSIRAYNLEGRIMVEYLGAPKGAVGNIHEFLGADILDVVRVAPTINATVNLGQPLTPRDSLGRLLPLDGSSEWLASPLNLSVLEGASYYGRTARADGRMIYYAERENPNPDRVILYWLEQSDAAIHFVPAPGAPNLGLNWPRQKNAYIQTWPSDLNAFAHYTVGATGSTSATSLKFPSGMSPQLVYQDDPTQTEAKLNNTNGDQGLTVSAMADGLNRTLLKFQMSGEVWYVPLYTQATNRTGFQESDGLAVVSTAATVAERINAPAGYEAGGYLASGSNYLPSAYFNPFTTGNVEAAKGAIIPVNAMPGNKVLEVWWFKKHTPPSAAFQPFYTPAKVGTYTVSYPAAPATIVMASNAGSGDLSAAEIAGTLYVQNNRALAGFNPNEEHALMIGGRAYALRDDLNDISAAAAAYTSEPFVLLSYTSPVDARPAMRAFKVLRELDLPGTVNDQLFNYPITAGTIVQPPMPLPLLPLPTGPTGTVKNLEVPGLPDLPAQSSAPSLYEKFTFKDRKGYDWVYRGPHGTKLTVTAGGTGYTSVPTVQFTGGGGSGMAAIAAVANGVVTAVVLTNPGTGYTGLPTLAFSGGGGTGAAATAVTAAVPTLGMQFYYTMREGFFIPGLATPPAVGTVLPYLRPLESGKPSGDPVTGTSLTVIYRPVWPGNAPELRVAETLTLPKFGLPAVYPQVSAQVLYQQSIANLGVGKNSVILHDPIREKSFALGSAGNLDEIPLSIRTTSYQGKTYFQGLPPHLQSRFFYDPVAGSKGSLVLKGAFIDEIAGEDYLYLNVFSAADKEALEALPATTDTKRNQWLAAVAGLSTKVETFVEDLKKPGTYIPNGDSVIDGPSRLSTITHPDTAVVKYALTATGGGDGWVTMVFGNGKAFTPDGDPVVVQVFKVAPQITQGELKVHPSSNPLDEQVSLRHSGDFAARPEDYEFEWRYAPPQGGVAPGVYGLAGTSRISTDWQLASSPAAALPTTAEYTTALSATLPRAVTIIAAGATASDTRPGLVARSTAGVDFSAGIPGKIVFSALVDNATGFVLYVNGAAVLAHNLLTPSFAYIQVGPSADLVSGGLARQFGVSSNAFRQGVNTLEVALYSTAAAGATSTVDFRLHASVETDLVVASGSPWQTPNGTLTNQVVVGGSPTSPLGNPLLVMSDNYFTMRYRPKASTNSVAGTAWSRWMPPKLVEGWIKRVLAGINPFNQRVRDLYNNSINTDVSLLTQAGKRWDGNVALSLTNINDFGLIEIYETVLNRGKNLSIDSGYDYPAANDALLLAAGYLADLYTVLGNEAYADADNPTIAIDEATTVNEVNTARFSFEGQVKSVLEEELALLRGRDDFAAPSVSVAPAHNRLYWNYTRGINSGEALYAVNYNIREKTGAPTANGILDAADAQRMFPQGHGDAYGHYLTALKGYYRLLQSPKFTWTPRTEAVGVLGQTVQIDYFDERKFVGAAVNVGRAAQEVIALSQRQFDVQNVAAGWEHLRDGKLNATTGVKRHWGMEDWTVRATQGAYFNWIVGNALLPDKDIIPTHTGIQIIDRTTVLELGEIPALATEFQTRLDNANAHLNPLGLTPDAIAFDISSTDLKAGKSHYEQIYERALRAVLNAKGAFDQAARMSHLLRDQETQMDDYNTAIFDQEWAYNNQLLDIYGTPYPGQIGPGKNYAQGYTGPDFINWFIVDRPTKDFDTTKPIAVSVRQPVGVADFTGWSASDITGVYTRMETKTITIQPDRFVQFADVSIGADAGIRYIVGTLQMALVESYQANLALQKASAELKNKYAIFNRRHVLLDEMFKMQAAVTAAVTKDAADYKVLMDTRNELMANALWAETIRSNLANVTSASVSWFPQVIGLSWDPSFVLRGVLFTASTILQAVSSGLGTENSIQANNQSSNMESLLMNLDQSVEKLKMSYEQKQQIYEYELLLRELSTGSYEIVQLATNLQRCNENLRNISAAGDTIQAERLIFRQRAAALIQGYRTKDLTFRTFRNEALEQYRSLFDLASRYTYLAAKSYDYETGLLGSAAGQALLHGIVASRALGDLTGGLPQSSVSTLGDAGLAGTMARLQADWAVAKPRLGINSPDENGTVFSLRRELFRLTDATASNAAWQQTLEQHVMSNILADPDVLASAGSVTKADGSAVPGIVIPFSTTIAHGLNFFGLPLAGGDHAFSATNFATKIYSVGVVFRGYIGMDPYAFYSGTTAPPNSTSPNSLSATPHIYLIPTGTDLMSAPAFGDTGVVRGWRVKDQALPLPFNLGATAFSSTQFFNANGTLAEQAWIPRKHQAFRPVSDPAFYYSTIPSEFTSSRLVGRSVWNTGWKLVIPAYALLNKEQDGINRFVASVTDIELFLRTYSNSGN